MVKMTTTDKINHILKEKKIPKMQFYKDCGITSGAYSLWNQGKTNPTISNLYKIASYLQVPVSDILGDDFKMIPELSTISYARKDIAFSTSVYEYSAEEEACQEAQSEKKPASEDASGDVAELMKILSNADLTTIQDVRQYAEYLVQKNKDKDSDTI